MKISKRKRSEYKDVAIKKAPKREAPPPPPKEGQGTDGAGKRDAAVSERDRIVSKARTLADAVPEIRVDKVTRIQDALGKGGYRVAGEKVADKMVRNAVQEIRNRRH